MNVRRILSVLAVGAVLWAHPGTTFAQIFVTNLLSGTIGKYDAITGAPINTALVSGLDSPWGLALSGNKLFVVNEGGTVGEYTTSGAVINASLISGLAVPPFGIAVSGGKLFVTDATTGTIGVYDAATGAAINASLVSGLNFPIGIAASGAKLFVVNSGVNLGNGTIGVYDAVTGATINSALVSGLEDARDITVHGGSLFVSENLFGANSIGFVYQIDPTSGAFLNSISTEFGGGPRGIAFVGGNMLVAETFANHINKYNPVTGELIDIDFISDGLSGPEHIVVAGVPDSGPGLLVFGALLLSLHFLCRQIFA